MGDRTCSHYLATLWHACYPLWDHSWLVLWRAKMPAERSFTTPRLPEGIKISVKAFYSQQACCDFGCLLLQINMLKLRNKLWTSKIFWWARKQSPLLKEFQTPRQFCAGYESQLFSMLMDDVRSAADRYLCLTRISCIFRLTLKVLNVCLRCYADGGSLATHQPKHRRHRATVHCSDPIHAA